jgi:hypothetical protein
LPPVQTALALLEQALAVEEAVELVPPFCCILQRLESKRRALSPINK